MNCPGAAGGVHGGRAPGAQDFPNGRQGFRYFPRLSIIYGILRPILCSFFVSLLFLFFVLSFFLSFLLSSPF